VKRQHPIAYLRYTTMNVWLLLFPLMRALINALTVPEFSFSNWLYSWVTRAYIDLIFLALIFGTAFLRWMSVKYEFRENCFYYKGGVLFKLEFAMPYSIISSVTSKRILWARPTKAVSVYIDSPTRSPINKKNDSDVYIITDLDTLEDIFKKLPEKTSKAKAVYVSPKRDLLLFSFVFSSTLSGVIFFAALIVQGGRMVRTQLEERFFSTVEDVTELVNHALPEVTPAAVAISLIIAAGWLYSFLNNLVRHLRFKIQRCGNNIIVENGFFSKWKYYISLDKINYADIRQSLLMKLFKVMSVHISCSGYGNSKNEIPVLVPVTTRGRVESSLKMLLPRFSLKEPEIKPRFKYKWKYLGIPIFLILLVFALAYAAVWFFPDWYSFIAFLLIMLELPLIYLLLVKFISLYTSGVSFSKDTICLKYCKFTQFHDVTIPLSRVAITKISQTILQKRNGSCDFTVYPNNESTKKHRVKGLPMDKLTELM